MNKIIVIALIFLGEALAIYSEMLGAKTYAILESSFFAVFYKMFLVMAVAGGLLVSGYVLGYGAFKNIWIVSVISITSILLIEPILAYSFFHQMPTRGALIGLGLGAMGFVSVVFIK